MKRGLFVPVSRRARIGLGIAFFVLFVLAWWIVPVTVALLVGAIVHLWGRRPRFQRSFEEVEYFRRFHRLCEALETLGKPVLAAIEGFCVTGGLELALACDIRVGAKGSTYAIPAPVSARLRAPAARSGCHALSAQRKPWRSCSQLNPSRRKRRTASASSIAWHPRAVHSRKPSAW